MASQGWLDLLVTLFVFIVVVGGLVGLVYSVGEKMIGQLTGSNDRRDVPTAAMEQTATNQHRYKIADLIVHTTPKAEKIFEFSAFPQVEFAYPGAIRTVLFGECVEVRASLHGGKDYYQVVGRLFESDNPKETDEKHVGKLLVSVYDHPQATRYETEVERLEWHSDGSFDLIESSGQRTKFKRPEGY